MAVLKSNSAEGGSNGTAVTAANSGGTSGTAWNTVDTTAGVWTYSNAQSAAGGLSYKIIQPTLNSTNAQWDFTAGTNLEYWGRMYMYYTGYPTSSGGSTSLFRAFTSGFAEIYRFDFTPTGQIRTRDASLTQLALSTAIIALNAWYRFEWHIKSGSGTSGQIEIKVFSGDSTTPIYTYTNNACNTGGSTDHIQFGPDLSSTTLPTCYMDEVVIDNATYPGPVNTGANVRPSLAQGNSNGSSGSGTSLTCSYTLAVVTGDLLVVAVGYDSTSATATITDSVGNTYQAATAPVTNTALGTTDCLFYGLATNGGSITVTATFSASVPNRRLLIHEYSSVDTLDVGHGAQDTVGTTAPDSGPLTTRYANEVIVGWASSGGGTANSGAGSGFTLRETALSQATEDMTVTSIGTYDATYVLDNTKWIAQGAAFYSSKAVPPTSGFIASYTTGYQSFSSPQTLSITTNPGDFLVVYGGASVNTLGLNTPTGNGVSLALQASLLAPNADCPAYMWTGFDSTGGTNWTLSCSLSTSNPSNDVWGFSCLVFRNMFGAGAVATSIFGINTQDIPYLAIKTTKDHSYIVLLNLDFNSNDGTNRNWVPVNAVQPTSSNGYETDYVFSSGNYTVYGCYYPDAGLAGIKPVGLSAPNAQAFTTIALEVIPNPALFSAPWFRR